MKVYIACALTHVPRDLFEGYVSFIHELAASLTSRGHSVKYALVNSDPQLATKPLGERARLCYVWDSKMVEDADVVIAETSFPSVGLGIELQIATSNETPVILCIHDFGINRAPPVHYENPDHTDHELQIGDGFVSLMALGLPSIFRVIKYGDKANGIEQIQAVVDILQVEN